MQCVAVALLDDNDNNSNNNNNNNNNNNTIIITIATTTTTIIIQIHVYIRVSVRQMLTDLTAEPFALLRIFLQSCSSLAIAVSHALAVAG